MDASLLRFDRKESTSRSAGYERLAALFSVVQQMLDNDGLSSDPRFFICRAQLAKGLYQIVGGKLVLEGEELSLSIFSAFFKRCAILWSSALNELGPSQRLLLKLDYCQTFTIQIFNKAQLDLKISMATRNIAAETFILEFCVTILQGNYIYSFANINFF